MRREGYEMAVSRPRVVIKQIDGVAHEPYEQVTVDADSDAQGDIMEALGSRGARAEGHAGRTAAAACASTT